MYSPASRREVDAECSSWESDGDERSAVWLWCSVSESRSGVGVSLFSNACESRVFLAGTSRQCHASEDRVGLQHYLTRHEVYSTIYTHRDRDQVVVGGTAAFHQMRMLHRYLQQYLHGTCRAGHSPYCTVCTPHPRGVGTGVDSGDASGSSDES